MAIKSLAQLQKLNIFDAIENFSHSRHRPVLMSFPPEIWPGSADTGRALITAMREFPEGMEAAAHAFWRASDNMEHPDGRHSFSWLKDLRAAGGDVTRKQARVMIESWIERYGKLPAAHPLMSPSRIGQRLAHWLQAYDFCGQSADTEWQERFAFEVYRQARYLARALPGNLSSEQLLQALTGLIMSQISLEGHEEGLNRSFQLLAQTLQAQILSDGGHVSRSPAQLVACFQRCFELRTALAVAGRAVPPALQHALDRMGPAMRFFRYGDRKLAVFHGTQEDDGDRLDQVMSGVEQKGKILRSLPVSGFERMTSGRALMIVDHGLCPPSPYDMELHASPLAFEFTYGRDRIFVNCGTHPTEADWHDALRATAAHNTLAIDDRNALEICDDGRLGRVVRKVLVKREETDTHSLLEASHDGYVPLAGITHHRRLYLSQKGHDLRGEDTLTCTTGLMRSHNVTIRFHLHPRVLVSLIRDDQEALLRLPSGIGWRFNQSGAKLHLENSIYLGEGSRPVKTKQIVLTSSMKSDQMQICWALQREGL